MEIVFIDSSIEDFLAKLDDSEESKVNSLKKLLEEFGYLLRMPYSKKIGEDLYELRSNGKIKVRILYTFRFDCAVILHMFIKKTQKTPRQEIETALRKLKVFDNI